MNIQRLVTWITFLAVFAMAARISMDSDTWWHLRAGQWIAQEQRIPQVDHFSYTRAGEPWQYPGWIVELPMYWIYQALGPGGLNVWTAGMVTLAFVFIWGALSGGVFLRAFTIVLAAAASAVYWAARPYLVTFLLAAVFLWVMEDYHWRKRDHLWWLPLLMVLWVNSHGGFVVGFIIWGVYTFDTILKWGAGRKGFSDGSDDSKARLIRLMVIGGAIFAAVLMNPSGMAMYSYAFKTVSIGALQDYIQEWQSPNFHLLHVQPFAWLFLLTYGVVGVSRRRIALTDFLLSAGFAWMGLLAGRNIALFGLVAPLVLTRHAAPMLASLARRYNRSGQSAVSPNLPWMNWILLFLVVLAVAVKTAMVYPSYVNEEAFRKSLPVTAVEYLRSNQPPGRLFNSYNWGGYLLWALPEYPVFIDGRTDLYTDEVINEWLQVMRAEQGWEDVLQRYDVNLILVETDVLLDRLLEVDPKWGLVYEDSQAVVYQRH